MAYEKFHERRFRDSRGYEAEGRKQGTVVQKESWKAGGWRDSRMKREKAWKRRYKGQEPRKQIYGRRGKQESRWIVIQPKGKQGNKERVMRVESQGTVMRPDGKPESRGAVMRPDGKQENRGAVMQPDGKQESRGAVMRPDGKQENREAGILLKGKPEGREIKPRPEGMSESRETRPRPDGKPESRETGMLSDGKAVSGVAGKELAERAKLRIQSNQASILKWHDGQAGIQAKLMEMRPALSKLLEGFLSFSDRITEDYVLQFAKQQVELFDLISDSYEYHKSISGKSGNKDYINAVLNYAEFMDSISDSLAAFGIEEIISEPGCPFQGKLHEACSGGFSSKTAVVAKSIRSGFRYKDIIIQKEKVVLG